MKAMAKAWIIDNSNFREPWFAPTDAVYAETSGKAKQEFLKQDYYTDYNGEDITFLTLKVVRAKYLDKFLVNGELKTMQDIEEDKAYEDRKQRLLKLIADNPNAKAYIRKGGYYYGTNFCGYTERIETAGVYTIQEAVKEVLGCSIGDCMDAILINPIEHNKLISERIKQLESQLIA